MICILICLENGIKHFGHEDITLAPWGMLQKKQLRNTSQSKKFMPKKKINQPKASFLEVKGNSACDARLLGA